MIVAGGGTGSSTIFIGEQVNHTIFSEVLYVDFSTTSMSIAQRLARARKLKNIIWVRSWIEGIKYLGIGSFQESEVSGVLHHLKNPFYGLKILKDSLTSNGGSNIMVYAKYGRTSIYQLQHMMKIINSNEHNIKVEISSANKTLHVLPKQNWFVSNPLINDHKYGNNHIYDLLLHKRDVAFSMNSLFEWITKSGFHFVDFNYYKDRFALKIRHVFQENSMKRMVTKFELVKKLHITEILQGKLIKHSFYVSKIENSEADLRHPSSVLYLYGNPHGLREALYNKQNYKTLGSEIFFVSRMVGAVLLQTATNFQSNLKNPNLGRDPVKFFFKSNVFNHFLISRLLDSNRGIHLKTLYYEYRKTINYNISNNEFFRLAEDFYHSVKDTEMFLIRKKYVSPFPKTGFMNLFIINSM